MAAQISQTSWMAAKVDNPHVSTIRLVLVYILIGLASILIYISRYLSTVALGMKSSKSLFSQLLDSLFHAPMSFYDSTPQGRILSRVSILNMKGSCPYILIFKTNVSACVPSLCAGLL